MLIAHVAAFGAIGGKIEQGLAEGDAVGVVFRSTIIARRATLE